jgi:phage-related baseplate assembly protein
MTKLVKAYTPEELIARGAPRLFTTSAKAWIGKLVDWFEHHEDGPKRKLFPAQLEMVFIRLMAFALSILGEEAQAASEQRWLLFATGHKLDVAAANNSTFRLKASAATCAFDLTLIQAQPIDVFIKKGTAILANQSDGLSFLTDEDVLISSGQTTKSVVGIANIEGDIGNNVAMGSINVPLIAVNANLTATNTETSTGGANEETDNSLRFRAMAAHDRISKAGGRASYIQQVRAYSPAIIAVEVVRPQEGHIWIYTLLSDGAPSPSFLQGVADWMKPKIKRPQGDNVTSKAPEAVTFTISGTVRYEGDPLLIEQMVIEALTNAAHIWSQSLGDYLAKKTLTHSACKIKGVVDLDLSIDGVATRQLEPHQFGVLSGISLTMENANG